jgi:hypothetical protein
MGHGLPEYFLPEPASSGRQPAPEIFAIIN